MKPHNPIVVIGSAPGKETEKITIEGASLGKARNRNRSEVMRNWTVFLKQKKNKTPP